MRLDSKSVRNNLSSRKVFFNDWSQIHRYRDDINGVQTDWCYQDIIELVSGAGDKLDCIMIPERLLAIHQARPDAELVIDANGAWSVDLLKQHAPLLETCRVRMVEQPLPAGRDQELQGLDYPLPLCADESCQSAADLPALKGWYQVFNIKLDKCGGLTEALRMVAWCREHGRQMMVGNMLGSSLAMAPGFVVAQFCSFVDLDGPLWQKTDQAVPLRFEAAKIYPPEPGLWG